VTVEQVGPVRIHRHVAGIGTQRELLEEPAGMRQVPLGRAGVIHRLQLCVFGRQRRRQRNGARADGLVTLGQRAGRRDSHRYLPGPTSMNCRNSARVRASSRKLPSMLEVIMLTPRLCTPRVVMHSWAPSITTPTPRGCSARSMQLAICEVIFSCTWKRLE